MTAYAQRAPAEATNIRISPDDKSKRIIIQYDLMSLQQNDSIYIEIETASGRRFRPINLTGDVGKHITPGRNKTVFWDVIRDNVQLNDEEVEVLIRIAHPLTSKPTLAKTPSPAPSRPTPPKPPLVESKRSPLLPIVGWVATAGLGAYALSLSSALSKDVEAYNQHSVAATLPEWNQAEANRKSIDSRRTTFTLVAGATAVLLVANIAYTFARKASHNATPTNSQRTAWHIQPASQSVGLGLVKTF